MRRTIVLVLVSLAFGLLAACAGSDICSAYAAGGASTCAGAQACCTSDGNSCYYLVGGKQFNCAGSVCTDATAQVTAFCGGAGDVLPTGDAAETGDVPAADTTPAADVATGG
jgi:hypothetical protein